MGRKKKNVISSEVSKVLDDFILDKDKTFWYVKLSNGETVYQDDFRYGEKDIAWYRLKEYCKINSLSVLEIFIRFRSHTEKVITNDGDGVFFRNKVLGNMSNHRNTYFFLFGVIKNGNIHVDHWIVPEIIYEETDDRPIEGCEDGILWNANISQS